MKDFGPEIWIIDGPTVAVAGFHYPTRMTIVRLADKSLFVLSPTSLTDECKAKVEALGPVHHIVAPNALHHLYLAEWKRAYPHARLYAAPGLRQKRGDLAFDADLFTAPNPAWAADIDQVFVDGNAITTEVVFFHKKSGTAIFTDLLQQLPASSFKGWRKLVAKLDLMTEAEPTVPRKFRITTNRAKARAALTKILSWPAQKVLMAHGTPVERDAPAYLRRAFAWAGVK